MTERRRKNRRVVKEAIDKENRADDRRISDRRQNERVAAEILVEVETSGHRTYRRTANISMGGVGFHAPIPFRLGALVRMTLRPAGIDSPVHLSGEVIGVDESGRGNRIRFISISKDAQAALAEHLYLYRAPTQVVSVPTAPKRPIGSPQGMVREGILILAKDPHGRELRLRTADRVIGCDPHEADIVIDHPSVSKRHAHVSYQNGRHIITNLSVDGKIEFRGKPIHSLVLNDGMVFYLGQVKLQYLVTKTVSPP
jgi:hypothetical protein